MQDQAHFPIKVLSERDLHRARLEMLRDLTGHQPDEPASQTPSSATQPTPAERTQSALFAALALR